MKQPRRAFYPCCATDIDEPRRLLAGIVDEIIFCDKRQYASWDTIFSIPGLPDARFETMDARDFFPIMPQINVLFYRRDSTGEGGSNVYILSERHLRRIIECFDPFGGLIITDGSNHGDGIIRKMCRPQGYTKKTWQRHFNLAVDQTSFRDCGLIKVEVSSQLSSNPTTTFSGNLFPP